MIAKQILPSRADRVKVQRGGAAEALDALHAFYLSVYEHRAISRPLTEPEQRLLIGLASQARISTAKTGDTDLRRKVKDFVLTGRRWADGHPGYTAVEVESQYDALLTAMTDFLHRNR
ncbi:hypothetical protein [Curtobacterium sp. MCLR17_055]|uniref:hypothetical protein n=1 Tax=Curtobacterium sp. MCLR17_055 TaxID=2175633 RepID=UPI000DA98742|nr:hypothetical protein [Curtobacterium sp. MCLR17_055]PZE33581.1 hypothetical protein DEJ09_00240 [Curtobacterium sp. MCLR17_055]